MILKARKTRHKNAWWEAKSIHFKAILSLMIVISIQSLIYHRLHDKKINKLSKMILGQASIQSLILLLHQGTGSVTINTTRKAPMMRKKEVWMSNSGLIIWIWIHHQYKKHRLSLITRLGQAIICSFARENWYQDLFHISGNLSWSTWSYLRSLFYGLASAYHFWQRSERIFHNRQSHLAF